MSLRQRIHTYLEAQPGVWVSGDEIEKKSQQAGYKASTGSRRARELAEDGLVDRKEVNGTVFYSAQPPKREPTITYTIEIRNGQPVAVPTKCYN